MVLNWPGYKLRIQGWAPAVAVKKLYIEITAAAVDKHPSDLMKPVLKYYETVGTMEVCFSVLSS